MLKETEKVSITTKKDTKKKRKRNVDKGCKTIGDKKSQTQNKDIQNNDNNVKLTESSFNNNCTRESYETTGN